MEKLVQLGSTTASSWENIFRDGMLDVADEGKVVGQRKCFEKVYSPSPLKTYVSCSSEKLIAVIKGVRKSGPGSNIKNIQAQFNILGDRNERRFITEPGIEFSLIEQGSWRAGHLETVGNC